MFTDGDQGNRVSSQSSTEVEVVGWIDTISPAVGSRMFLMHQGYDMGLVIVHQENKSAIVLGQKGRSTSTRTRHIAIRYFFIKDMIDLREVKVVHTQAPMT